MSTNIQVLPASSVRALGSTQAITSPLLLLKELIENSIDAGSTSISVTVTPDLLSQLTVRDNGSGIAVEDRDMMARPHCTSKLEKFEDLPCVTTLGFRGEALASMAQVAGAMSILTKVEEEKVGMKCEIEKDGSVKSQKRAPCPRGTVVTVSNLFDNVPVRQATIEKTALKLITQVWPLLVSYYLTHPNIRFSFQVIPPPDKNKGKKQIETKHNVVFAASKNIENAIMNSLGKETALACFWQEYPDSREQRDRLPGELDGYKLEAFLLKPDAEIPSSVRKGAFISLCNRPLSTSRPHCVAKKIYSRYKAYIKNCCHTQSSDSGPFIYLNIVTTSVKAEVNIEPAKDDVLFEDEKLVLDMAKSFFEEVYGKLDDFVYRNDKSTKTTTDPLSPSVISVLDSDPEVAGRDIIERNAIQTFFESAPDPTIAQVVELSTDEEPLNISSPSSTSISRVLPSSSCLGSPTRIDFVTSTIEDETGTLPSDLVPSLAKEQIQTMEISNIEQPTSDEIPTPATSDDASDWGFNMYDTGMTEEEMEDMLLQSSKLPHNNERTAKEVENENDISISNPWTFAKLNSSTERNASTATNIPGAHSNASGNNTTTAISVPTGPTSVSARQLTNTQSIPNVSRGNGNSSTLEVLSTPQTDAQRAKAIDNHSSLGMQRPQQEQVPLAPIFISQIQRKQQKEPWFPTFGSQTVRAATGATKRSNPRSNDPSSSSRGTSSKVPKINTASNMERSNPWSPPGGGVNLAERISNIFPSDKANITRTLQQERKDTDGAKAMLPPARVNSIQQRHRGMAQFFPPVVGKIVPASALLKQGTSDDFPEDSDDEEVNTRPTNLNSVTVQTTTPTARLPAPQICPAKAITNRHLPKTKPLFPRQQQHEDDTQNILCKLSPGVNLSLISMLVQLNPTTAYEPVDLFASRDDQYVHLVDDLDDLSVTLQKWLDDIIAELDAGAAYLGTEGAKMFSHLRKDVLPREQRCLRLEMPPSSAMMFMSSSNSEKTLEVKIT